MPEGKLPNLPGSMEEDLKKNQFNQFFKKTPQEFWEAAEINHTELEKPKKCDHFFKYVKGGVECEKCTVGLLGQLDIINGKLFYKGIAILN